MKTRHLLLPVVFWAVAANAQNCKPDDFSKLDSLKESVRTVIITGFFIGWEEKAWCRSGDLVALAIVKAIPDAELTKPDAMPRVLQVLEVSFSCIGTCIEVCSDREPRLTLLLLDHLHEHSSGVLRKRVEKTRKFVRDKSHEYQHDTPP